MDQWEVGYTEGRAELAAEHARFRQRIVDAIHTAPGSDEAVAAILRILTDDD